jgi:hypothetical protein
MVHPLKRGVHSIYNVTNAAFARILVACPYSLDRLYLDIVMGGQAVVV